VVKCPEKKISAGPLISLLPPISRRSRTQRPAAALSINSPAHMTNTPTQGLDAPTELPRSQHAFAPEFLLRLLKPGSAQTIVVTSPDTLSATFIIDTIQTVARHAKATRYYGEKRCAASAYPGTRDKARAPIDRVGRLEMLNDTTGRELKIFRKSPCPSRARSSSPASDDDASGGACAAECSNDVSGRELDGVETDPPIDRAGRFEALNDATGRKLRVFRNSPRPPRARNSSPASDDDAAGGARVAGCSNDAPGREVKVSPCLHLGMPIPSTEDTVG